MFSFCICICVVWSPALIGTVTFWQTAIIADEYDDDDDGGGGDRIIEHYS